MDDNNTEYDMVSIGSLDVPTSFKKDKNLLFILSKTEKLSTAVYLVTNLLSDKEPARWKLRELVLDLMSFNISFYKNLEFQNNGLGEKIESIVTEIISIINVAMITKTISHMNASILKSEFLSVLSHIQTAVNSHKNQNLLFNQSFFEVPDTPQDAPNKSSEKENQSSILSRTKINYGIKDKSLVPTNSSQKPDKIVNPLNRFSPVSVKKNHRKSLIIGLLKKKKVVMVKDVTELIGNCSEKTVQRELLALVNEGLLKKEGERRWTKYSLV